MIIFLKNPKLIYHLAVSFFFSWKYFHFQTVPKTFARNLEQYWVLIDETYWKGRNDIRVRICFMRKTVLVSLPYFFVQNQNNPTMKRTRKFLKVLWNWHERWPRYFVELQSTKEMSYNNFFVKSKHTLNHFHEIFFKLISRIFCQKVLLSKRCSSLLLLFAKTEM